MAERLPAAPGRRRPLPQRRVPQGGAELGGRLPLPALLPRWRRRRRGLAPFGAHAAPRWPPRRTTAPGGHRAARRTNRIHGGGRSLAPLANEGEGEGRSVAAERQWWGEREEVERFLSMVAAEVRRGRFRRVCGLAGRLMADAVPAAEH